MYQLRQAERAARKEEEGGWLGQDLSAVAKGKGRARQWVRMEKAVERRGGPRSWFRRDLTSNFRGRERKRMIEGVAG